MTAAEIQKPCKLTIVIPCFNEEKTLEACINRVFSIEDNNLSLEVIIVDDDSTDGSLTIASTLADKHPRIIILRHKTNQGKGASIRTGFKHATGEFITIQDADLELDPTDLKRLLIPLMEGSADVVFGSRFYKTENYETSPFWHYTANKFLTFLSNFLSGLKLTDMECCYKMFKRELIQQIIIKENRFGVEPELVAKVAQIKPRVAEMGISYNRRTYQEGKKIGFRDGIRTIYCIVLYNLPRLFRHLKGKI